MDNITALDEGTLYEDSYILPEEWQGYTLRYHLQEEKNYIFIPILGILVAGLLYYKEMDDIKKKKQALEREAVLDYPSLVSKFCLFIGAGLSVRSSWEAIVEEYRENTGKKRYVYEEMLKADNKLKAGINEAKVYKEFANDIGIKPYVKLISLLEQNRKTGIKGLRDILNKEAEVAWLERVNLARRLGEEASTKLLLPLFLMLLVILLMIICPVMLKFR